MSSCTNLFINIFLNELSFIFFMISNEKLSVQYMYEWLKPTDISHCIAQVYTMYGFITTVTMTLTIICVTIQRRHLMIKAFFFFFWRWCSSSTWFCIFDANSEYLMFNIFAGMGFICSKVCFRCGCPYSYRCFDVFGLNLLFLINWGLSYNWNQNPR